MLNKISRTLTISVSTAFLLISMMYPAYAASPRNQLGLLGLLMGSSAKVFVFDPRHLRWGVYNAQGELIKSGHAVGGKKHCADVHRPCMTLVGTFRIYAKEGPNFKSSKYPLPNGGASMPWAMFFLKGLAIHGSNELPNHPASHGCIRVSPSHAAWLSRNLPIGTKVIVYSY